ncbi:hypothetical protein [Porphyromonas endodontalis]|uniref:hypothetical protein n=1 Tax=Porphyromonas endodontalis TaxID=28124 RepID=UPI0036F3E251
MPVSIPARVCGRVTSVATRMTPSAGKWSVGATRFLSWLHAAAASAATASIARFFIVFII